MPENQVTIKIIGDASNLKSELNSVKAHGAGMFAGLGANLKTAMMIGAGAIGVAVGAGKLFYESWQKVDEGLDNVISKTGVTGAAARDMEKHFKNVAGKTAADMGLIGKVMGQVGAQLNLSGKPLETVTKGLVDMGNWSKIDATVLSTEFSKAVTDWSIRAKDMPLALDKFTVASQKTGANIGNLMSMMYKFGSPIRQLGFSFDETLALLANFEKAGVNTELVMGSMRIALGRMAREGEPVQETFRRIVGEIKNTGDVSKANRLAIELFGARAGPDMAAAIREGRFEVGKLVKQIGDAQGATAKTTKATEDFAEQYQKLKNRIMIALEPLGRFIMEGLNKLIDVALPVVNWLSKMSRSFNDNANTISTILAPAFNKIKDAIERNRPWIGHIINDFKRFLTEVKPAIEIFGAALAAVFIAISYVLRGIGPLIYTLVNIFRFMANTFSLIVGILSGDTQRIKTSFFNLGESAKGIVAGMFNIILAIFGTNLQSLKLKTQEALESVRAKIKEKMDAARIHFSQAMTEMGNRGNAERARIGTIFHFLGEDIRGKIDIIRNRAPGWGRDLLARFGGGIRSMFGVVWQAIIDLGEKIRQAIVGVIERARSWGRSVAAAIKDGILSFLGIGRRGGGGGGQGDNEMAGIEGSILSSALSWVWNNLGLLAGDSQSVAKWGLSPTTASMAAAVLRMFPGARITSGYRSRDTIPGPRVSLHTKGKAVDIAGSWSTMQSIYNYIKATGDPRVKELIFNRRIWSPRTGEHAYRGSNPHTDHVHLGTGDNEMAAIASAVKSVVINHVTNIIVQPGAVVISAKDLNEMKSVSEFFERLPQAFNAEVLT